ncbi:amino acid permease [Paraoerskovia marina]|uniref:amino acid permease n=1 Tax=Paraoerskovia marina TaxID=545619 RepID=UPI0009E075B3|nr:amino acid permease [Paraoerskovia marina]
MHDDAPRDPASTAPTGPPSEGAPLAKGLRTRHLTMMGLGSAIGAGLFLGSGVGIHTAGPAVLISYMIAGGLVILLMRMLAEMATAVPASGSFSVYAETALGRWAGFTMGWLYWFMLIMVLGAEITGASQIMERWLPGVPAWVFGAAIVVVFAVVNLAGVRNFGEMEFWFAFIKVAAIVAFLVVGVLLVFGLLPGTEPVGTEYLLGYGGFAPMGIQGIASALLVVVFAFGGIEIVTIAAAEARDPQKAVAKATNTIVWRILFFYVGSIAIMVTVLPWNSPALLESPFVAVLDVAGLENASRVMEVVVVVALLSAFNANIYATSRMMFSLAGRGDAPAVMGRVSRTEVPWTAVLLSVFFGFVSVFLNYLLPEALLEILLNAVGAALLVIWIFIAVSQLRLRPRIEAAARESGQPMKLRMWGYPGLTWFTLAALGGLVLLMLTDDVARAQVLSAAGLTVVIAAIFFARERWRSSSERHAA